MMNRLIAVSGLVMAAFIGSTGVSSAFMDDFDRDEVMMVAGAVAIGFLVIISIIAGIKHALGADATPPEASDEDELGIRSSGFGGAYYDQRYGGDHGHSGAVHGGGHDAHVEDDGHGHTPAAHGAH